jgi:hypothetical protein
MPILPKRIKKTNINEYYLTENDIWVRNFALDASPVDLNDLSAQAHKVFLNNEFKNLKSKLQSFEITRQINNAVIVSDGYGFAEKQKFLAQLPFKDVAIFATNGALANWQLVGKNSDSQRAITWYVVNNPYPECKKFLPARHSYYPMCIASCRTNNEFVEKYKSRGSIVVYHPVNNTQYTGINANADFAIDDYRNPICAAIGLAYCMGVKKLALFCCDDSFEVSRPASQQLENGLWTYPQQIVSQNIIEGELYWLQKAGVKTANCSSGKNLSYSTYITPEQLVEFFKDE